MSYRASYRLYTILFNGGFIVMLAALITTTLWLGLVGLAMVIGGIAQAAVFYRCPECHEAFDLKAGKPKVCPHCGCELKF